MNGEASEEATDEQAAVLREQFQEYKRELIESMIAPIITGASEELIRYVRVFLEESFDEMLDPADFTPADFTLSGIKAAWDAAWAEEGEPDWPEEIEFEDWVRGLFDHPDDWEWHKDCGQLWHISLVNTVAHAIGLFETAGETLAPYSDHQIGQGLWALIISIDSPLCELMDHSVPEADRLRCLAAIPGVYEQVFAPRCAEVLCHLSEKSSTLNGACYIWWDPYPSPWSTRGMTAEENAITLAVMERALALPNAACQESALHGLGHWIERYEECNERATGIIDAFLASGSVRRPELIEYARRARKGRVQ